MATATDVEVNHNNEEESELCLSEQCDHEEQTLVDLSERQFTHEQEELCNRRYEEKYDVPDPIYLKWLKINHPDGHQMRKYVQLNNSLLLSKRNFLIGGTKKSTIFLIPSILNG